MKLDYRRTEVDPSPICPSGIVYRPMVTLRIGGSARSAYLRALIDTGANHTIVPFSVAENVAAELYRDKQDAAKGIGGQEITIIPGRVELELLGDGQSYKWTAVVGFAKFDSPDDECSILGHAGCLEYFLASFDGVERVVELVQIGDFPSVA
ncbi:MAG TPA: hypothetical protein VHK01_21515 [Lacipirellulaceae bacterium]|nr:hypothetical protein [Lacipirellulaceae bacterium]